MEPDEKSKQSTLERGARRLNENIGENNKCFRKLSKVKTIYGRFNITSYSIRFYDYISLSISDADDGTRAFNRLFQNDGDLEKE